MRLHFGTLLALAAAVAAQTTEPKIPASELKESMTALTEAVEDAVKLTSNLPSEAEAVKTLSKDLVDIGRGSSVVLQALPRPGKENEVQYPKNEQGPICDKLGNLANAALSLVESLESVTNTLSRAPELREPIKHSVQFMSKALVGLVRRTMLVGACAEVGQGKTRELKKGFEKVVKDF